MALAAGDWSVAANGDIRSVTGSTNHEVLELHRFLMDLFDNFTGSGDDLLDVTGEIIPSARSTDNIITLNAPYNIDDTAAQRFFNGSVSQAGGDTLYSGLQVLGTVNSGTTELQIVQNNTILTSHWGTGKNVDAANNILLQIMVKSRDAGADIDGKRVRVFAREWGDSYAEFNVTLGQGVSVAAITTLADDFNVTAIGTIAAIADISNVEGYQTIDLNNGNGAQPYYAQWDKGANSTNDLYERVKWLTRRGSASTLYGLNGALFRGITHQIAVDGQGVTDFLAVEPVSWPTGTGQLLAVDDLNAATTMWIQLLTGVAPTNNDVITGGTSAATCNVNVTVTQRTLPSVALGTFTGALTSAYGVGVQAADIVAADKLRDLNDVTQQPPNNVVIAVNAVANGDVVFLARTNTFANTASGAHTIGDTTINTGSAVDTNAPQPGRVAIAGTEHAYLSYTGSTITLAEPLKVTLTGGEAVNITAWRTNQHTTSGAGNTSGNGTLTVDTTIAQSNPSAGVVRVFNSGTGVFDKYSYTSFTGAVFTLSGTLGATYSAGAEVFVPFIDETATGASVSATIVYPGSDIAARLRVYNSAEPIVPFEVGVTVGAAGSTTQAIRAADA